MNLDYFAIVTALVLVALSVYYAKNHRNHDPEVFVPVASWLRAFIYFCFCYLMAWKSGVLEAALSKPVATPEQLASPLWRSWVLALFLLVSVGYWVIWARFTIRFERKVELVSQVIFGVFWGLAAGFLFLSIWYFVAAAFPDWPQWGIFLVSYATISVWQWLWQDYGWDVYISPEHDCPWSIKVKVPATHIPNVTFCLIFFAIYGNHWIFVGLQTWALIGASIAMRMPSPWCKDQTPAARRVPGMFGAARSRASGYTPLDPASDPYVKSTGLPASTAIWVLGAHLFTMLCPILLIASVQQHREYLESVMYAPSLLYYGAGFMILGGVFEIAQNSFKHQWYYERGTPGFFNAVFGTLVCFAMAIMITACYGDHLLVIISVFILAIAYPVSYISGKMRGFPRALLGLMLIISMYYTLGDPVVFLSLVAVFLTIYFFRLLMRTHAQAFHGFLASVSAFGMLSIPIAINNSAQGEAMAAWQVFAITTVVVFAAIVAWSRLSNFAPTPQMHS